jgi:hypothetical protein
MGGHAIRMEENDPAEKVLSTKPRGNGDRRCCDKLEEDVAWGGCRIWRINLQSSRSNRKSLRRPSPTLGCNAKGSR